MIGIYLINIIVFANMALADISPLIESDDRTKAIRAQTPQIANILGFRSLITKRSCGKSYIILILITTEGGAVCNGLCCRTACCNGNAEWCCGTECCKAGIQHCCSGKCCEDLDGPADR